ncbi:ROK family transcriptional regulator [uncultured Sphingomonas sp.]|uniref:ROK family transcriptional regulator n=1 Tax=uncultured Sphingomonas sp. TaxID=158754 RepID=UPI0025EE3361|nr:ROK family transcriptional regulator [uncultured Sphingomonas sp.]
MDGRERSALLAGANIEHAGQHNQRVVLHAIRVNGTVTRADIAAVTGLTHATVTNITNRLLDDGLLARAGQRRGARGQPAMRLTINPAGACSIGVNVDRDHLTLVAVDFGGAVRARISRDMAFPMPADVRAFYREEVDRLLAVAGIGREQVAGVGVALPDQIGEVELPGRPAGYGEWAETDVAALFAEPHPLRVWVENDAAAAAIGEMQFGLGQRYGSFFYLLVTYALGGGLVVNSLYDRGANGRSGEIGFLMVDDGTGRQVALQNLVSLAGLARRFEAAGLEGASVRSPDQANPAVAREVQAWVEQSARALVQPLIAVNCLIDPETVLIGGRLPVAIVDQLAQRTNALLRIHGRNAPVLAPVQAAAQAEDAAAVGAALLPFEDLLLPADAGAARRASLVAA